MRKQKLLLTNKKFKLSHPLNQNNPKGSPVNKDLLNKLFFLN